MRETPDRWADRWWIGSPEDIESLRAEYGHNFLRFRRARPVTEEHLMRMQERGMEAFVKLERSLLRRMRQDSYRRTGQGVFERFGHDATSNAVFVAIDFEGTSHQRKINGLGLATFTGKEPHIDAVNYGMTGYGTRKFLFGPSTKLDPSKLDTTIVNYLQQVSDQHYPAKVILVGHGLHSELQALELMGLSLEDLPVAATIDTGKVAQETFGYSGALHKLLRQLNITWPESSLHCAGNDAYFTIRALSALLMIRHRSCGGRCLELIKQPFVEPVPRHANQVVPPLEHWTTHLDGCALWTEAAAG